MTSLVLPAAHTMALAVSAALVMLYTGTKKKLLRWKPAEQRCQVCGRSDRHNCPCRR